VKLKGFLIMALAAALWSGCSQQSPTGLTNNAADGSAANMAQEISDMGSSVEFTEFGGMAKQMEITTTNPDTIKIQGLVIRRPWAYDNGWWVREIEVTINQRSYSKIDSVKFHDANSDPVQVPGWSTVTGWIHYRHVERVGYWATHRLDFAMEVGLEAGTQKVGTWNGTVTGTLDGIELSSTTVTDVVRTRATGYWRFPESGTVIVGDGVGRAALKERDHGGRAA